MVCCAIISFILAGLFWPLRSLIAMFNPARVKPLLWQLSTGPAPATVFDRPERFSLSARAKSVSYAVSGLGFVIRNEHNARIHIAAAMGIILMGLFYKIDAADWLILVLAIVSVWFAETINTAFEYLCDVVSPEKNESVRNAKDIAAGAVLITALGAVVIGVIVMLPYITNGIEQAEIHTNYMQLIAENLCLAG